jgi:hypothetical protein
MGITRNILRADLKSQDILDRLKHARIGVEATWEPIFFGHDQQNVGPLGLVQKLHCSTQHTEIVRSQVGVHKFYKLLNL